MTATVQAGPAADYGKASRTQQAQLLQQWSAAPEASRLPLLQALNDEAVVTDENGQLFTEQNGKLTALEGDTAPAGATKKCL